MFSSALIVFREVLEACMIIGIVLAATRGIPNRSVWVAIGVLAGLVGAGIVAFFAEAISTSVEGMGQELFNAFVLLLATVMLAWHQIWMSQQGRAMAGAFKDLGQSVRAGDKTLGVLAVVVGVAMLREGSEAVLFLFGVTAAGSTSVSDVFGGALLGVAGGALCGGALYAGLLKIPTRSLFTVTGALIVLLAAGMASQAAAFLVQAGMLSPLSDELWNSSALLPRSSAVGELLHILVGYDDRPSGMQLVFYVTALTVILGLSRWVQHAPASKATSAAPNRA